MKTLFNFLIYALFFMACCSIHAQKSSKKLKREQIKLEKKISNTKMLLNKTKNEADISTIQCPMCINCKVFRKSFIGCKLINW